MIICNINAFCFATHSYYLYLTMMTVPTRVLLQDLQDKTEFVLQQASLLGKLSFEQLNTRTTATSWSIAECLHHLNLYSQYYLPHIRRGMLPKNMWKGYDTIYKSTWLGNWFANSMLPNEQGAIKKMSAPKSKTPLREHVPITVLADFVAQQLELKEILFDADKYNVNKVKVSISIAPFVRINLGDTLRFCINHNIRHIHQAMKVYNTLYAA